MNTLVKYNAPVHITTKAYPPNFDETDDGFLTCNQSQEISEYLKSGNLPNLCKAMAKADESSEARSLRMLNEEFPPIYEERKKEKYVTTVRDSQSTVMELENLGNSIKMELLQRTARRRPLCHVRKAVLDETIRELLRQLIIDCPERAILFKQCCAEFEKNFETYGVLLHFNDAFMCRKYLKEMHITAEQRKKIDDLEQTKAILELQVILLKQTADELERKNTDLASKGGLIRERELTYYRTLGEQLKAQLDASIAPPKEE